MSARKYKFNVTDIDALAAQYPKAVIEEHIPARVERKAVYSYIAGLLDLGLPVPGIEVVTDEPESDLPAILGGKAMRDTSSLEPKHKN